MTQVDPLALAKIQLHEQAQELAQLRADAQGRQMLAFIDVVNAIAGTVQRANAGDPNGKHLAEVFIQNLDGLRAVASSKLIVPPGARRAPVEPVEETLAAVEAGVLDLDAQQRVAGQ